MRRRGSSWRYCECAAVAAFVMMAGCGGGDPTIGAVIGPSGSAGITGNTGAAGSGPPGTAGDTGAAGVAGTAGVTGAAGTTGAGGSGGAQSGCADLFDPGVFRHTRSTSPRTSLRSWTPSSTTSRPCSRPCRPRVSSGDVSFRVGDGGRRRGPAQGSVVVGRDGDVRPEPQDAARDRVRSGRSPRRSSTASTRSTSTCRAATGRF